MVPYVPTGRNVPRIKVPVRPGVWKAVTTGTYDKVLARRMHQMVRALGHRGARAYDLLERMDPQHPQPMALWDLWAAYEGVKGDVPALRAALADVPLASYWPDFLAHVTKNASADTAKHYAVYLRALEAEGVTHRADLSVPRLSAWLDALEGSAGTRRKYAAGVSAFCAWLVRKGELAVNPMRDVPKPSAAPPRMRYLDTPDAIRLADAQPEPYRTLSAVLAGTALDLSVALTLTRRMVDAEAWTITVRRQKTGQPQQILVAEWCRPYLARALQGKLPDARLFEGVDRWTAGKVHRVAANALGFGGYWLRDARHTWAVRWAKANGSPAQAALQLGHKDGGVLFLRIYGSHIPTMAERAETEARAALRDRGTA